MKKILFVCTGNTCRSSMAEAIFKDMVKDEEKIDIQAESAGIEAINGMPANDKAIATLKAKGIDLSAHSSRRVSADIVEGKDLILAMTRLHKIQLLTAYPQAKGKVFTLKEYASNSEISKPDIADPYGQPPAAYERCADELERAIRDVIDKIFK